MTPVYVIFKFNLTLAESTLTKVVGKVVGQSNLDKIRGPTMGIGVVTNPKATQNRKDPGRIRRLERILGSKGVIKVAVNQAEVVTIAREFKKWGVKVLGVDGGDGTLHYTLTAFMEVYDEELPYVVHLKGGAMNTIAKSIGVKGNPEKLLGSIVRKIDSLGNFETVEVNLLKINHKYGFIFGTGFAVNFLELYYKGDGAGPQQAVKTVLRTAYSIVGHTEWGYRLFQSIPAQVFVDGRRLPCEEYTLLLGYTVSQVGLGFKPGRMFTPNGYFQFLGCALGGEDLLLRALKLYWGIPLRDPRFWEQAAKEVLICWENPQKYTIDGEIFNDCQEISIQVGPKVRFLKG